MNASVGISTSGNTAISENEGKKSYPALTGKQEQVLKLLGDGFGPEVVASSVGVSVSYVSQLLSDETFAERVANARMEKLTKYNELDSSYDRMEMKAAKLLENCMTFVSDPLKLVRIVESLNRLKRRGSSSPESITNQQTVVTLNMPVLINQKFSVNVNNQVVNSGNQALVTVQPGALHKLATQYREKAQNGFTVPNLPSPSS